ncbi:MAG TPA: sigma-54 dependent transcriptional regulator [Novimethylophilus sp.]|jgi:DNA-binding NtrC family response regulator|uniref:sigma-54-dependent transcriptional regulator n=1 Tax=Novimethylophilus sp. TaxID=2137426 RepID=UPI002F3F613D
MHVLVVDDEAANRQILSTLIARTGYSVDVAAGVKDASDKLSKGDVDVALCDIRMPDGDGIELVHKFRTSGSGIDTQFIMVTAFASMETAVEALRAGATDYIVKPINEEDILHRLAQVEVMRGLREENKALRRLVAGDRSLYKFTSPAMQEVDRLISKVAGTNSTILITGESGTGKGIAARALHEQSPRAAFPFIPVNCGAIPENLLESEFFGHTKGAFTGADKARKGLFSQADRGTLFLDEIGEMPMHLQTKLLHVIEDKQVRPLGSEQTRSVDTRIIAATNRNPEEMVKEGKFREDLYFRLSMFHIRMPPLRERGSDINGLIQHLLHSAGGTWAGEAMKLDADAHDILQSYHWPGNIRQLENVVNRANILADGGCITLADLPPEVTRHSTSPSSIGTVVAQEGGLRDQMRQVEASLIAKALSDAGGDRKDAAQRLGIGLSSLYRKLEELSDLVNTDHG